MSRRESIARLNHIINRLRRRPCTFEEINHYLDRQSDIEGFAFTVSKRTFQRDLDEIRSLYSIDIQFDRRSKVYRIADDEFIEAQERIIEAFDTISALNVHDRLQEHLLFEKRRPQGTQHLYGLLHAIKNNLIVKFEHQKYWEEEPEARRVEPLALKEFKYRWYLMAHDLDNHNQFRSFGLDRISQLEITNIPFQAVNDISIDRVYEHCFGIIQPDDKHNKPAGIILSFDPFQGKYIKSLPLHSSQKVLIDNGEETRIALFLYPTFDFVMELLSYGSDVKVIEPKSLAEEVKRKHFEAAKAYQ